MNILLSLAGIRFDRGMGEYIRMFLPFLCKEFKERLLIVSNKNVPNELLNTIFTHSSLFYKKEVPYPVFEQFLIPKIIKNYGVKVAYFPANTFPLIKPKNIKFIVTIHDLMFLKSDLKPKNLYQKIGKAYRAFIIKNGIRKVDTLICNSNSTLNEFKKIFGIPKNINEISVVYNPLNFDRKEKYDDSIIKILNIDNEEYIYTISGTSPNKNFDFVLKAFSKLRSLYPNLKLVVSGIYKPDDIKLYKSILKSFDIENSVIFTGYVTEEQKKSLMKNCKAFIFLSKDEGFGRPIIEALIEGATVIASDIEVFREIGGKYVCYVDVNDDNCLVNFFLNYKPVENDYNEMLNYLKAKFDVNTLANKLIKMIYQIMEDDD